MSTIPKTNKMECKNLGLSYRNDIANLQIALEYRPLTSPSVIHRYDHIAIRDDTTSEHLIASDRKCLNKPFYVAELEPNFHR